MLFDFGDNNGVKEAHHHPNGGGIVADTAHVDPTVFLDRGSFVFGHAVVKDRVRIVGRCRISGDFFPGGLSTLIEDDCLISGSVMIEGHVLIRDRSQIRGSAKLSGGVAAMHRCIVTDRATVAGDVQLRDHTYIHEDVTIAIEDGVLILKNRDLLGGDGILRTAQQVNQYMVKPQKARKIRPGGKDAFARDPGPVIALRRSTVMPCPEDMNQIMATFHSEVRLANS